VRLIRATFDPARRHAALWVGPLVVTVLFLWGRGWHRRRFANLRPFVVRWGPVVVTWHDAGGR
jgi:hypothetical protein